MRGFFFSFFGALVIMPTFLFFFFVFEIKPNGSATFVHYFLSISKNVRKTIVTLIKDLFSTALVQVTTHFALFEAFSIPQPIPWKQLHCWSHDNEALKFILSICSLMISQSAMRVIFTFKVSFNANWLAVWEGIAVE